VTRRTVAMFGLLVIGVVQFVMFPVNLRVGDTWESVIRRLRLVPRLPVDVGFAHESHVRSRIFLLPDLTCVELVALPSKDSGDRFVLHSIQTGPRFQGYPGKFVWLDGQYPRRLESLSLSGYTFLRLMSYVCFGVFVGLAVQALRARLSGRSTHDMLS
jgi:hypothetical protein